MTPTYDMLVKELESALETICYLGPEEFDDKEHEETFLGEIARVQAIIDSAKEGT